MDELNNMDDIKKYVEDFVAEAMKDIVENKTEEQHCVILYKCRGFNNEVKYVHKVYKSIGEFAIKGEKDINEIDESRGVNVQLWFFD